MKMLRFTIDVFLPEDKDIDGEDVREAVNGQYGVFSKVIKTETIYEDGNFFNYEPKMPPPPPTPYILDPKDPWKIMPTQVYYTDHTSDRPKESK